MKKLIILMVLISISLGVQAQDRQPDIYPEQVSIDHNSAVQQFSRQFISSFAGNGAVAQSGSALSGFTNLVTIMNYGSENLSELNQTGLQNLISLTIFGDRNQTTITQDGSFNSAVVLFDGNENNLGLTQEGSFNRYFNFRLGNGLQDQVLQSGNNLFLEISGDGLPVTIEQYGDGAEAAVTTRRGYN
jgi:hypothetical protein